MNDESSPKSPSPGCQETTPLSRSDDTMAAPSPCPHVIEPDKEADIKQIREELRTLHLLFTAVFESVPIGLCIADTLGIVRRSNRYFSKALGLMPSKVNGQLLDDLLPEDALKEGTRDRDCRHAEGGHFRARIVTSILALSPDDYILVALSDQNEQFTADAKLREAQRLESLGTLAGGIAHDFNNLLAIVLGYASLLKQVAADNPRVLEYGETIMDAGRRGADVVRQLMLYANQHEPLLVETDVHSVLGDVLVNKASDWPESIRLECNFLAARSTLAVDSEQLGRAIEHLLKNAREAITGAGTVWLRTADREANGEREGRGRWVEISVQDTGRGMDEATKRRMFEPFFVRNKGPQVRGLGLPMVYGIVTAHRGKIEVKSAPGQGTTVSILLPHAIETAQTPVAPSEPQIYELKSGASVLLVEDEEDIAKLWNDLLLRQGWTVHWARDGEEAMRLFDQHKLTLDLLFSDIGLPGDVDGWEVCTRIRAERPKLPILIASGYFKRNTANQPKIAEPVLFVDKPYQPTEVLDRMRILVGQL